MSDPVHTVTDLAPKTSVLKKVAKRGVIAALAVGALAAIYLKTQSSDDNGPETTTT